MIEDAWSYVPGLSEAVSRLYSRASIVMSKRTMLGAGWALRDVPDIGSGG